MDVWKGESFLIFKFDNIILHGISPIIKSDKVL